MGFRSWLLVIASVLFFLSLIATGIFFTLSSSLAYDNIKSDLAPVVSEMISSSADFKTGYQTFVDYCRGSENVPYQSDVLGPLNIPCNVLGQGVDATVNYYSSTKFMSQSNTEKFRISLDSNYANLSDLCIPHEEIIINDANNGFLLNVSCDSVLIGPEAIVEEQVQDKIDEVYYKDYDCSFFDCIKNQPLSVVSENTHNYFWSKFLILFFVSLILFVVLFLLVEVKSNSFILAGILIILAGIPLLLLDKIFGWVVGVEFLRIFSFLFNASSSVFFKLVILAVILIVVGIIWKTFAIGFKINDFFAKFNKQKVVNDKKK